MGNSKSVCTVPRKTNSLTPVTVEIEVISPLNEGNTVFRVLYNDEEYVMEKFQSCQKLYLSHPHLLTPLHYTVFKDEKGTLYNVTLSEFCPYGKIMNIKRKNHDERVVRTFFRQLVEAVEYLHESNMPHMAIRYDKLYIGKDYKLRLGSIDSNYNSGIGSIRTSNFDYDAPEMSSGMYDPFKADIYMLGVTLFTMHNGSFYPFIPLRPEMKGSRTDEERVQDWKLREKIFNKSQDFWSEEFKSLFDGMTEADPEKRISIKDIKESAWYNGEILEGDKLQL